MSDEYERKYMSDGGVVHETKSRAPLVFHLIILLPMLLALAAAAAAASGAGMAWTAALPGMLALLVVWLFFTVLRATVTTTHVHIQYGLFGPKIPLERIEACEAVSYDWKQYGGWGIRRGRDGSWAYNMMGDQGRAVRLRWQKDGETVTTLLSTPDPEAFAAAVARARRRARIDVGPEPLAEAEQQLEAELSSGVEPSEAEQSEAEQSEAELRERRRGR